MLSVLKAIDAALLDAGALVAAPVSFFSSFSSHAFCSWFTSYAFVSTWNLHRSKLKVLFHHNQFCHRIGEAHRILCRAGSQSFAHECNVNDLCGAPARTLKGFHVLQSSGPNAGFLNLVLSLVW